MLFRLVCDCGASCRAEVSDKIPAGIDPVALALRVAFRRHAWAYRGGQIGKSVISAVCPKCRNPLYLEADVQPADATPSTYEEDVAIVVPTEDFSDE